MSQLEYTSELYTIYYILLTFCLKSPEPQLAGDRAYFGVICFNISLSSKEYLKDFELKITNINNVWHIQAFIRTPPLMYVILFKKVKNVLIIVDENVTQD